MTPPTALRPLLAGLLALALLGCGTLPRPDGARSGPFHTPANVRAVAEMPDSVRRIALLPVAAGPAIGEAAARDLDRALATALVAAARAEITPVPRERLARLAGRAALLSTSALPPDLFARVAAETGADAVLFVDVTAYSAYPPLVLGLRARLVPLDKPGSALLPLWNFDNVFATTEAAVINSARAFALRRETSASGPGDLSQSILQNPGTFADYAAAATWATLPPRVAPAQPELK